MPELVAGDSVLLVLEDGAREPPSDSIRVEPVALTLNGAQWLSGVVSDYGVVV